MNSTTVIVIAEVSMTETMSEGIYFQGQTLCLGKVHGKPRRHRPARQRVLPRRSHSADRPIGRISPPFNDSDTALRTCASPQGAAKLQVVSEAKDNHRKDDDVRWSRSEAETAEQTHFLKDRGNYGVPPKGNANFAWVQHFIHHLAPDTASRACGLTASEASLQVVSKARDNMAGFVLANGSMSSNQSGEGEIRKALIDADLVDCMVALPGQLFYSTQIPVCLWFLTKSKAADTKRGFRARRQQTLFIDARKMGTLIDRIHRELTDEDLDKITSSYHAWRGDGKSGSYEDIPGFCKSSIADEIATHGHVLTPGRYVGAEEIEDDGEPFTEKMPRLVTELRSQFAESSRLEKIINANLEGLGYGG